MNYNENTTTKINFTLMKNKNYKQNKYKKDKLYLIKFQKSLKN